jgi:hypothetical protein
MMAGEGRFSGRRCPNCGAELLTDGRGFWCNNVNGLNPCHDRAESETDLANYQPGAVVQTKPAEADKLKFEMYLKCENGHEQTIIYSGLDRPTVEAIAGLLDASSPMYVYPVGPDSLIGRCGICRGEITAEVRG